MIACGLSSLLSAAYLNRYQTWQRRQENCMLIPYSIPCFQAFQRGSINSKNNISIFQKMYPILLLERIQSTESSNLFLSSAKNPERLSSTLLISHGPKRRIYTHCINLYCPGHRSRSWKHQEPITKQIHSSSKIKQGFHMQWTPVLSPDEQFQNPELCKLRRHQMTAFSSKILFKGIRFLLYLQGPVHEKEGILIDLFLHIRDRRKLFSKKKVLRIDNRSCRKGSTDT